MSDHDHPSAAPNEARPDSSGEAARRPRRRWLPTAFAVAAIALGGALAGGAATSALGHGWGFGSPWHHGFMSGPLDPAQIDKRVERAVKHLAVEIDATPEQQARLIAIAQGAVRDLLPLREARREMRTRAIDLLSAPSVDRAAVEQLRGQAAQRFDAASRRIAQAVVEAGEALTPEQRRDLAERARAFQAGRWGPWHR